MFQLRVKRAARFRKKMEREKDKLKEDRFICALGANPLECKRRKERRL